MSQQGGQIMDGAAYGRRVVQLGETFRYGAAVLAVIGGAAVTSLAVESKIVSRDGLTVHHTFAATVEAVTATQTEGAGFAFALAATVAQVNGWPVGTHRWYIKLTLNGTDSVVTEVFDLEVRRTGEA